MKFRPLALLASMLGFGRPAQALLAVQAISSDAGKERLPEYVSQPFFLFHARPDSRAFGQSATCARMRRHNRMRRLGIGGARI